MWTSENEKLIQKWGSRAQYNVLLYEQAAHIYQKKDRWFGIPLVILGALTTSGIFLQLDLCHPITQWVVGISALVFTILTAVNKLVGYQELMINYTSTAQSYDDLVLDIQYQLSKPRQDRMCANDFISNLKFALKNLKKAPAVPIHVYQQYIKNIDIHFENIGIPLHNDFMTTQVHNNEKLIVPSKLEQNQNDNPPDIEDTFTNGLEDSQLNELTIRSQTYLEAFHC